MAEAQPPLRPNTLQHIHKSSFMELNEHRVNVCPGLCKRRGWVRTEALVAHCFLPRRQRLVNEFEEGEGSGHILEAEVHLETDWKWKDRRGALHSAAKDRTKVGIIPWQCIELLWTVKTVTSEILMEFKSFDVNFMQYLMQEPVQPLLWCHFMVECVLQVNGGSCMSYICKSSAILFSICTVSHASFTTSLSKAVLLVVKGQTEHNKLGLL